MAAARASAVLAVDGDGRPVGILTEQDVARRVAFRLPPEAPLSAAMTAPVIACAEDAGLWRPSRCCAPAGCATCRCSAPAGAASGMLHRAETLAAVSGRLLLHLDALSGDDAAVKRAQAGVAAALLRGRACPRATWSAWSAASTSTCTAACWTACWPRTAPPPVPFTLLVMGSAGRGESLLRPDQDNGLILGDYADADARRGRRLVPRPSPTPATPAWPTPASRSARAGSWRRNPLWRKTLPQWCRQFDLWAAAAQRRGAAVRRHRLRLPRRRRATRRRPTALRAHLARACWPRARRCSSRWRRRTRR